MHDAFRKEDFICRAIIFVTTNDYPTLFALSGQIKGKTGCLVCLDGTTWVYLDAKELAAAKTLREKEHIRTAKLREESLKAGPSREN